MSIYSSIYPHRFARPVLPLWVLSDEILLQTTGAVRIGTAERDFPKGKKYFPTNSTEIVIPFRELMLCAGIMSSGATSPTATANWAFLLEHMDSFAHGSAKLRYATHLSHWDARIRQVFSERVACGVAAWCLWNVDKVVHIADAGDFIGAIGSGVYTGKSLASLGLYGKNGKLKPDYFCLTTESECVIAECKGSLGPPSVLSSAIKKGKEQVSNVKPSGVSLRAHAGQLVFALNLRGEHEAPTDRTDSTLSVVDPEFGENALRVETSPDLLALASYGKALAFVDRSDIYGGLLTGARMPEELVSSAERSVARGPGFFPLAESRAFIYGLRTEAAINLLTRPLSGLAERIASSQAERRRDEGPIGVLELPNGFVAVPKPLQPGFVA